MASTSAKARSMETRERASLRRRLKRFYLDFNEGNFESCFQFVDPDLRSRDRVDCRAYTNSLAQFRDAYGPIDIWHVRLSLHMTERKNIKKPPFAFAYIFWRDKHQEFHVFQERWIKHDNKWYTRVAGLVVHEK